MKKTVLKTLRYFNNFPFPFTAKHYAMLGEVSSHLKDGMLMSTDSWLVLRNEHPHYRIPDDRETWLKELYYKKDGQDDKLQDRVNEFAVLLEKENIKTVYSIGSGGGIFEYFLKKRLPSIKIFASEPTQVGVDRLRKVFLECDVVEVFDALNPKDWEKIGNDPDGVVFIYRNEREFTNDNWRKMFEYMHQARVQRVFLGLMYLLTILAFTQEKIRNVKLRLRGKKVTFVGYLRNYAEFKSFWYNKYTDKEIPFPNCRGLYLTIIK